MDPVFATVFERGRELLVCVKGSFFFGTAPLSTKKTIRTRTLSAAVLLSSILT